jgi:6-phosphofructokinase 2
MAKIVTVTFNPCIDKNTIIPSLAPEKKLRCTTPEFEPGGGGINVSRVIKCLGGESLAIFPAGAHTGNFLKSLMKREGLQFATADTSSYTRENLIVLDESTKLQYRFGMPGNPITTEDCDALLAEVEKADADYIIASGSLLPGMPVEIVQQVAQIAKVKGAKLVMDTSGEALKKALDVGVYLLKPNLGELSSLVGEEEVSHETVDEIAREIIAKGQSEIIVVSMGSHGAKLITRDEVHHVMAPLVKSVSTLGAGDSLVAGMTLALSRNWPLKEVLQFGVACGTAATLSHGSDLCSKKNVERLFKIISGKQFLTAFR